MWLGCAGVLILHEPAPNADCPALRVVNPLLKPRH
jgi:hypothetical protein